MAEIPFPGGAVDGTTFFHEDKVCVYHGASNTWECRTVVSETPTPPDTIYTTDVLIPDYDPTPDTYNLRSTLDEINEQEGGIRRALQTQADLNQETVYTLLNQRRRGTRGKTTVDFLQNTVTEGDWEYEPADQGGALPEQGYFHLFDVDGNPTSDWSKVKLININGTGRNAESLEDIRRGAVINMQDVLVNSFAQYVVEAVRFIGNPEGGQFWIEAAVAPRYNRAVGIIPDGAVCEIQVISQYPCITTKGNAKLPKVNNDGYLWYDENTMTLYVSNWDDSQSSNGSCTWISVDITHLKREVLYVGPDSQPLSNYDGSILSGTETIWQLGGANFPLQAGMKILIDTHETTIVSVEDKEENGQPYREIITADSIILDPRVPYETSVTVPMIGGHPYWEDLHNQSGGGSEVHVGENPPAEEEGALWFDTTRLELYVYYVEGEDGGWVPTSPLGARVAAGEAKQLELEGRINQGEQKQALLTSNIGALQTEVNDRLKKTGDTFTGGALRFKRTDDSSYWSYITFDTPEAWKSQENTHGVIINIGQTNSYKQQLKIQGRSGSELFKLYDDNKAVANLYGDLTVTGELKANGKTIDDDAYVHKKGGTQNKMQGDLYLGGFAIKGVGEPSLSTDAATKAYVDSKGSGGGSFQTKYDGNFFCVGPAITSKLLNNGEVMFFNESSLATTAPGRVHYIGFNIDQFNWDSFLGTGIIRVRSGANDAGYYQVFKKSENAGRNMIVWVKPVWTDTSQALEEDSGTPCYFQGVFFE